MEIFTEKYSGFTDEWWGILCRKCVKMKKAWKWTESSVKVEAKKKFPKARSANKENYSITVTSPHFSSKVLRSCLQSSTAPLKFIQIRKCSQNSYHKSIYRKTQEATLWLSGYVSMYKWSLHARISINNCVFFGDQRCNIENQNRVVIMQRYRRDWI